MLSFDLGFVLFGLVWSFFTWSGQVRFSSVQFSSVQARLGQFSSIQYRTGVIAKVKPSQLPSLIALTLPVMQLSIVLSVSNP